MHTCDVLIVGGGPAGSSCAWQLRDSGLQVVVLDKAVFPRDKVCAGWITPAIIEELQLDVADYAAGRVLQPFTGFLTGLIGRPGVVTDYGRPVSYGIRRCEFDHYLLSRCGAEMRLGEPLKTLRPDGESWLVNESLQARLVIGAGGHFCPVARMVAQRSESNDDPVVLAQEVEFEIPERDRAECPVAGERPELYFCPDLAGYGWIVRKGHHLNIGLGREGERNLSAQLERFLTFLRERGRLTIDIPRPFHGHAYYLRRYAPPVVTPPGVLLIGDAAGLAYPQSGEGIRPAIESGLLAAQLIRERGLTSSHDLSTELQRRFETRFGRGAKRPTWTPPLANVLRHRAAGWLMQTRWFNRRVLLDRWFLHAHQAALGT
ncbi:MAG TPA: NAD(P)/FAD-dependent oxidoreductase [Planctomycetaceae bacterium]|nr:NAD(P)/FAD-dependent oxidoreductase [Planctomycetaceae bacterium]